MKATTHDGSPAVLLLPALLLAIACAHAEEPWARAHELDLRYAVPKDWASDR